MSAGTLDAARSLDVRPLRLRLPRLRVGVLLSGLVLALAVLATIAPQLLTSGDPLAANPLQSHQPPSLAHLAGTDIQGRDVLVRIIYGARYSLLIGLGATVVAVALGVAFGVLAGISSGWLDRAVSRLVDVVAAFPEVLLALLMIAFTGRGVINLVLALGVAGLPKYARTVRANVQLARQLDIKGLRRQAPATAESLIAQINRRPASRIPGLAGRIQQRQRAANQHLRACGQIRHFGLQIEALAPAGGCGLQGKARGGRLQGLQLRQISQFIGRARAIQHAHNSAATRQRLRHAEQGSDADAASHQQIGRGVQIQRKVILGRADAQTLAHGQLPHRL